MNKETGPCPQVAHHLADDTANRGANQYTCTQFSVLGERPQCRDSDRGYCHFTGEVTAGFSHDATSEQKPEAKGAASQA